MAQRAEALAVRLARALLRTASVAPWRNAAVLRGTAREEKTYMSYSPEGHKKRSAHNLPSTIWNL